MTGWADIRDGGRLLHLPAFLPAAEADTLLGWVTAHVEWRQEHIFGRPAPRLNAWYAADGLRYSYSGLTHVGTGWPAELGPVLRSVGEASGEAFNSLLLNRYRDGQDSISFHADDEPELGADPVVATLSLGSEREFRMRHPAGKERLSFRLGHGSLLVMAGTTQAHWLHAVPKTDTPVGERVSLTFRRIVTGEGGA